MVFDYTLKLSLGKIPFFVEDVLEKLEPFGINQDILFGIRLSLEEALANAVKHGNKMDKNKNVFLKINATPDKLEVEVKDEGKGFDYKNIPLPTEEENLPKISGRGIFLIKNFMDSVEFFDGGSKIRMIKDLR